LWKGNLRADRERLGNCRQKEDPYLMETFSGKVAIVTGGGSGIGRALGEELARRGARLILIDVNAKRIEQAVDMITHSGDHVEALQLDVSDFEAVQRRIHETVARYGRLDYIFNNAGISVGGEVRDCAIDDWREVLEVNLYGVVNGVSIAYPIMVKQGFGHIVNTASIEGLAPFPGNISYVASKYGVVGLSNALRVEGADLGVKVSVVCPGYIKTAIFHDSRMIKMDRRKVLESLSRLKGMTPQDCALAILRGVERNKAIIVVPEHAKLLWMLQRLSPGLVLRLMQQHLRKSRKESRIED
jgi:NAD(P)-dependent dehydrogenase (short-subunit alcohol dehydrogenase family)